MIQVYKNKITNKLFGVVHVKARAPKKGVVLLSYITSPFTQAPGEYLTDPHTNYWECAEIARLFSERGYDIDIINAANNTFIPHKNYAACIDVNKNLERLAPLLPSSCLKVLHITFSYGAYQNAAEKKRLQELFDRRGMIFSVARPEPLTNSPAIADYLEGFGNSFVHSTYAQFNKPIYPIPISVTKQFDFPEDKDFEAARTNFLWFGGGGAILKGLDLVVEAFAKLPEFTLHVVGPSAYEKEFETNFKKELSLPNIKRYPRPRLTDTGEMYIGEIPFMDVLNTCAALIYPSASEGTSGAVIQAMHAGVVPIVTKETGVSDIAPVILLTEVTIEHIIKISKEIASSDPESLKKQARLSWEYARRYHTKETFSKAYGNFIDTVLKL